MEISFLGLPGKIKKHSIGIPQKNIKRVGTVLLIVGFVLLVFLARFFYIGVIKHHYFAVQAEHNKNRIYWKQAKRGVIYDRNHQQLVFNKPQFSLILSAQDLPSSYHKRKILAQELSVFLKKKPREILELFKKSESYFYQSQVLKKDLSRLQAIKLKAQFSKTDAVKVVEVTSRYYPQGKVISHILGYTGKPTSKELSENKNLLATDHVGRAGIEKVYDQYMQGTHGKRVTEVNAWGKKIRILQETEAQPGSNLVLTIDLKLQEIIYQKLKRILADHHLQKGAAVALDPNSGEILALVSIPSYNNNEFSENYDQYKDDPLRPLFNRAIAGLYPPGSSFKPVVALGALEEKVISATKLINDSKGFITVASKYNPNINYTFHDWRAHGWVDMREAIAKSCNVYFYTIGGGYKGQKGLGIEKIKQYAQKLGFSKLTGVDLPGEARGRIPDPEWKKEVKGENWYIGDTYNSSIGQGDIAVTPLQIAQMTAFFANGGKLLQPHLLKQVLGKDHKVIKEFGAQEPKKLDFSPQSIKVVREGMRQAVTYGTARRLKWLPVDIAGKTGTAQFGTKGKTHAWFTSFAPYEKPEMVLTILIEEGGERGGLAVQAAKEIYEQWLKLR